jgi:hypothetical protein
LDQLRRFLSFAFLFIYSKEKSEKFFSLLFLVNSFSAEDKFKAALATICKNAQEINQCII